MNSTKLATILRDKSEKIAVNYSLENNLRYDLAELLNVLARICEGKDILHAFGAPGDWGYGTPIGDALIDAYRSK